MMFRRASVLLSGALVTMLSLGLGTGTAPASDHTAQFTPGAPGAGDPYFPLDGNGGYDVQHYLLDVSYDPATDLLAGVATITAGATQNLSAVQPRPRRARRSLGHASNGPSAQWSRSGRRAHRQPRLGPARRADASPRWSRYDGVPADHRDQFGQSGSSTPTTAPSSSASPTSPPPGSRSTTIRATRPRTRSRSPFPAGLEAVANGMLRTQRHRQGLDDLDVGREEPMASYLATATIGRVRPAAYRRTASSSGTRSIPTCSTPPATARHGQQFALSAGRRACRTSG